MLFAKYIKRVVIKTITYFQDAKYLWVVQHDKISKLAHAAKTDKQRRFDFMTSNRRRLGAALTSRAVSDKKQLDISNIIVSCALLHTQY